MNKQGASILDSFGIVRGFLHFLKVYMPRQYIALECQTGSYEGEGCPLEDCKQLDKQQPHSGEKKWS